MSLSSEKTPVFMGARGLGRLLSYDHKVLLSLTITGLFACSVSSTVPTRPSREHFKRVDCYKILGIESFVFYKAKSEARTERGRSVSQLSLGSAHDGAHNANDVAPSLSPRLLALIRRSALLLEQTHILPKCACGAIGT